MPPACFLNAPTPLPPHNNKTAEPSLRGLVRNTPCFPRQRQSLLSLAFLLFLVFWVFWVLFWVFCASLVFLQFLFSMNLHLLYLCKPRMSRKNAVYAWKKQKYQANLC